MQLLKKGDAPFKFGIIILNAKNKLAGIHIIGAGSLDHVHIETRDVFLISFNKTG